jgi:hypothetical protein
MAMREFLMVAALAGCGGGSKPEQPTAEPQPIATPQDAAAPTPTPLADLEAIQRRMCICDGGACVQAAIDERAALVARVGAVDSDRWRQVDGRFTECMQAIMRGQKPPPMDSDDHEMTAAELLAEYRANEVAADRRYRGRMLYVSGVVRRVQAGDGKRRGHVIQLAAGDFHSVHCVYSSDGDRQKLEAVRSGKRLAVFGTGDGAADGEPIIDPCEIGER